MARYENLHVNKLTFNEAGFKAPGDPNQVARYATGIVDFDGVPTANDTQVIGGVTYTWVADPSATTSTDTAVKVDIGANAAGCATNLAAAINASGTSGTTYAAKADGTSINANGDVKASIGFVDAAGDAVVVSARKPGAHFNTITFTESADNTVHYEIDGSTVATTLTGGVSGNNVLDAHNYTNISLYNADPEFPNAEAGGAAATTINTWNTFLVKGVRFMQYNATAQTISYPTPHAKGLSIAGDQVENEIVEISPGYEAESKHAYRVGRDGAFKLRVKLTIEDVSGTDACLIGWRKAEAGQADWNDYDELIAFNIVSGDVYGSLIKNNAATDSDDLANNWADGESHTLELYVGTDGTVTLTIDGAAPSTAHAGTLKFDGNEVVVPFIHILQDANLTQVYLEEFECGQDPIK
jgi:hypothetical protein